jgi:hypothetical protein
VQPRSALGVGVQPRSALQTVLGCSHGLQLWNCLQHWGWCSHGLHWGWCSHGLHRTLHWGWCHHHCRHWGLWCSHGLQLWSCLQHWGWWGDLLLLPGAAGQLHRHLWGKALGNIGFMKVGWVTVCLHFKRSCWDFPGARWCGLKRSIAVQATARECCAAYVR